MPPSRTKIMIKGVVFGTWYFVHVVVMIVMTKLPVLLLCPLPDQCQCHR